MIDLRFQAVTMMPGGALRSEAHRIRSEGGGFVLERPGLDDLVLGAGFCLLETRSCGVCATDLARPFLPFDLPQIIGHEVLARDEAGRRLVVEINASCLARRLDDPCPICRHDMPTHCERRMTLGIDRLPGGFGPWILAPVGALIEVPDEIDDETAVLMEPFAAALHAVDSSSAATAEEIAVLGPRRLGMLIVAALAARRREGRVKARIRTLVRRPELGELALRLGADAFELTTGADPEPACIVFETSGNPQALDLAIRLARRELHLKSTHGVAAGGLDQLTALVVDELGLDRLGETLTLPESSTGIVAIEEGRARALTENDLEIMARGPVDLGRRLVVRHDRAIDRAIRPLPGSERSLAAPRSTILLDQDGDFRSPLARAVLCGMRLRSSRCGDFRRALQLLRRDADLRELGRIFVTHRFSRSELARAFEAAADSTALKVIVS